MLVLCTSFSNIFSQDLSVDKLGDSSTQQMLSDKNELLIPIKILQFKTTAIANAVVLACLVEGSDLIQVEIQRSLNNHDFETISHFTVAKSTYFDKSSISQTAYYRLKAYYKSGATYYSAIQVIAQQKNTKITTPYFSKESLIIGTQPALGKKLYVRIFSVQGQLVKEQQLVAQTTIIPADKWLAGLWLVCVYDDNGLVGTFKVVK